MSHEQPAYRTRPDTWQTNPLVRLVRCIGRRWTLLRHVRHYCQPLVVTGDEALRNVRAPALVIVNHTSHFDTPVALSVLPPRLRERTAIAAAADRFYAAGKRGWWWSMFYNTFPIDRRGGGGATLEYPLSLLNRRWLVLMYPEGTRSTTGELGSFHHGVAYLAMRANVPVIPIYSEGLRAVMPKGQRSPQPAPVSVRIGAPVWLDSGLTVPQGTALLEEAMRALAPAPAQPLRR